MSGVTDLHGKTAFITGGASGIGFATAKALVRGGARVALGDLNADELGRAAEELRGMQAQVSTHQLDVRDRAAMHDAAAKVERDWGAVHILFNNAGLGAGGTMQTTSPEEWDLCIGVNLNGVYNGIHAFVPAMIAHGLGGHVVSTASMSGLLPSAGLGPYTASKFAVVGLSECLRMDLEPHGIGVSVLCPGFVRTGLHETNARHAPRPPSDDPASVEARRRLDKALANGVDPDEVGQAVAAGILANTPWIITHPKYRAKVEERMTALLAAFGPGVPA
jgi:NAD(P)-dependent dehydrogenase (short-subunit alcohol dehydrogenase family)